MSFTLNLKNKIAKFPELILSGEPLTVAQGFAQNDSEPLVAAFGFFMFNCVYILETKVYYARKLNT